MRKTKEVLRLRFELGLGQRAIARACSINQGAVHNYLKKAAAAGIHWPLPEGWDEKRIEEALFGDRHPVEQRPRVLPDFPALREQLQRHPHLTPCADHCRPTSPRSLPLFERSLVQALERTVKRTRSRR